MTADTVHITADLLRKLEADEKHLTIFRDAFPDGVTLTSTPTDTMIDRVASSGLDMVWLCRLVLAAPAWAEYERVTAPAWAEYERVTAPVYAKYRRAYDAAVAEYDRVCDAAWSSLAAVWSEFKRVRAAAVGECRRVIAPAEDEYLRVRGAAWSEYWHSLARAGLTLLADRNNWKPGILA